MLVIRFTDPTTSVQVPQHPQNTKEIITGKAEYNLNGAKYLLKDRASPLSCIRTVWTELNGTPHGGRREKNYLVAGSISRRIELITAPAGP